MRWGRSLRSGRSASSSSSSTSRVRSAMPRSPSSWTCSSRSVIRHDGSQPVIGPSVLSSRSVSASALARRIVEQALGDAGPPAAARVLERDVVARGGRAARSTRGPTPGSVNVVNESARKITGVPVERLRLRFQRISVSRSKRGRGRLLRDAEQPDRHGQVRERRGGGAEPVQRADRREHPRAQRRAVDRVVVERNSAFSDAMSTLQRALALARLALEAEVEDLVQALVAERLARGRARSAP